ncbi:MAG TPA: hypothetical protein VLA28_06115, partial [Afifellaceae bacterium]|nr:hypothetical protein [Afifellaceae bacterium]
MARAFPPSSFDTLIENDDRPKQQLRQGNRPGYVRRSNKPVPFASRQPSPDFFGITVWRKWIPAPMSRPIAERTGCDDILAGVRPAFTFCAEVFGG